MPKFKLSKIKEYRYVIVLVTIALALLCIGLAFYYYRYSLKKPVVDSKKTEMKHLPLALKQAVVQQASPSATLHIPILMYHYIEHVQDKGDKLRISLDILPEIFDQQLKTLKDDGFTFITAGELGKIMDETMQPPPKPIVLTFDDGYRDFYTDAFPILKKYNAKGTEYIISGFIDHQNYMFKEQIQEIAQSGLVEIGAHTVNHPSLKGKLTSFVHDEVVQSKKTLEEDFNIPVVSFAYPNGSFDEQAVEVVKQAGFSTAVSTIPGIEESPANRYFIYRIRPGGRTGTELLRYLQQPSFKPW